MRNSSTGYHVASAAILTAFLLANILGVLPGIGLAQTDLAASRAALDILDKNCFSCHGAAQMSGLDIRQRETLLKGGKRGPAIIPGNPEGSLLYKAVAHQGDLKMPLGSGSPLPREQLEILKKWIKDGAPWPTNYAVAKRSEPAGWSFKKPQRPAVPHAKQGKPVANPIDAFVLARLEEKGLRPAPPADKLTLVRRAYFDLIGLPPTPEEVDRFVADSSPNAWTKLIDSLLASPRYGERWARHWLDVVRYADSAGFESDVYYENAWRYRDYVIKSFNDDKPYDRFVQEQIAGDELWPDVLSPNGVFAVPPERFEHLEARIGTTLYTFGPEIRESHQDLTKLRYERLTDAVDTTASAFLGLTLKCARCHDHKFDPFPQRDYYRLQAVFAATDRVDVPVVTSMSAGHRSENYHYLIALDEARSAYQTFEKKIKHRSMEPKKKEFSPAAVKAFETPVEQRTGEQNDLAAPLDKLYQALKIEDHLNPPERPVYEQLIKRLAKSVLDFPQADDVNRQRYDGFFDVPSATVLRDLPVELVPDTYVYSRGDLSKPLMKVNAGLPNALLDDHDPLDLAMSPGGPRLRKQLALWLTKPDHPLTARVMVNRIWQGHFGRGIVATENDFGRQGQPPTHPELLDWLATEFVRQGWSIKAMHRLIMLSNTYQMTSRFVDPDNSRIDPDNAYLWRMNRRRLEGEEIWDAIHAAAGDLNLKMYGRPVMPPLSKPEMIALRRPEEWVTPADPQEANRRGVYVLVRRNFSFPLFDRFDMPVNAESCPRRDVTTVAPQVLWTLNNQASFQEAQHFASRLVREAHDDPSAWIKKAWGIALSRRPTAQEEQEALALIQNLAEEGPGKQDPKNPMPEELAKLGPSRSEALAKLCLAVFNLDEFIYID